MDSLSTLCRSASILQLETVDDVCFVKSWIAKNQQEEITSAQNDKLTAEISQLEETIMMEKKLHAFIDNCIADIEAEEIIVNKSLASDENQRILSNKPRPYLDSAAIHYGESIQKYKSSLPSLREKYKNFDMDQFSHRSLIQKSKLLDELTLQLKGVKNKVSEYDGINSDIVMAQHELIKSKKHLEDLNQEFNSLVSDMF